MANEHTFRVERDPRGGFAVMRYLGSPKRVALYTSEAEAVAEAERLQKAQEADLRRGEANMPRNWQRD